MMYSFVDSSYASDAENDIANFYTYSKYKYEIEGRNEMAIIPKDKIFSFYKTSRPGLHAFRAICGALAIIALFFGLRELPLADVVSLTFGGPIFVTIASIIFLSERVGVKRWSAVFLGFLGMLLIVQPAFMWWFGKMYVHPESPKSLIVLSLKVHYIDDVETDPVWETRFEFAHVDQHSIFIHPQNPNLFLAGNDGGIYFSQSNGSSEEISSRNWCLKNPTKKISVRYVHPTYVQRSWNTPPQMKLQYVIQ